MTINIVKNEYEVKKQIHDFVKHYHFKNHETLENMIPVSYTHLRAHET